MRHNPAKPEEAPKAFACSQVNEVWSLDTFARHISGHNGVFSRGTVKGVLCDMCECLIEQLLNGNKVQLGELGTFGISLKSVGAPTLLEFTARNIKDVNIIFTPGVDFENLRDRADFNPVPSRLAQVATLKAEKNNLTSVDLGALKDKNNKPGGGAPQGGGSTTDPNPGVGGGGNTGDAGAGGTGGADQRPGGGGEIA